MSRTDHDSSPLSSGLRGASTTGPEGAAAPSEPRSGSAGRELVFSRLFVAPRELVWRAWTQADRIARWWGPNGFTTTTQEMEVRPGGRWSFVMHGPDGTDYPNTIRYEEVERPSLLRFWQEGGMERAPMQFSVVVTFVERAGTTEVTMCHLFPTLELRERSLKVYGADEGARQTLARLADHLRPMEAAQAGPG